MNVYINDTGTEVELYAVNENTISKLTWDEGSIKYRMIDYDFSIERVKGYPHYDTAAYQDYCDSIGQAFRVGSHPQHPPR